jgi:hypothetical protein
VGAESGELTAAAMMWRERNGQLDCRSVNDTVGVTLYASKEAAVSGEIVWSDTLGRYLAEVKAHETVALHP